MKLKQLLEVVTNDEQIILFKLKDKLSKFQIIEHPFFSGNEEAIRLKKGSKLEVTIFNKDNSSFSWHWGDGSSKLVSDTTREFGRELDNYANFELGIYTGGSMEQIKKNLEMLKSDGPKLVDIKVMGHLHNDELVLHINEKYVRRFANEAAFEDFFNCYFKDAGEHTHYVAQTGVNVEEFTAALIG